MLAAGDNPRIIKNIAILTPEALHFHDYLLHLLTSRGDVGRGE